VTLITPYALPFQVMYQQELVAEERNVTVRIVLRDVVSEAATRTLAATVLPFLMLATSGALAGESIRPWTSTIKSWRDPIAHGPTIEWFLTSVSCDLKAWVMLAHMLMADHKTHTIERVEIVDAQHPHQMIDVLTGRSTIDPYPKRWAGIDFPIDFHRDIEKNFSVYVTFARELSAADKESIAEEFFAWAPGLMCGAYGVAPVPPERCTGFPDEEIVFVDNELEWPIRNFKAHTAAIEGLINVLASVSEKIVRVTELRVD